MTTFPIILVRVGCFCNQKCNCPWLYKEVEARLAIDGRL